MPITSSFDPTAGALSTFGDTTDDSITTSRDVAGKILVNGGAVPISGGTATVANTSLVQVFGQSGNDTIALDETNGALPAALLFGGSGNDSITGGSGADQLFGQDGNDLLLGKGGNDFLFGGAGDDVLIGGSGDDQLFGEAGNDTFIWNPGDGTDLVEGGDGIDTLQVNGGNGAENFTITPNGTRVRVDRVSPAPFSLDVGTTENIVINGNGGDDVITASNGLAGLVNLTIDGGAGNDTITGGDGADTLIGGDGDDVVIGGRGNDAAFLGAGNDSFVWNPGDGSDTVEGGDGIDALLFNGANVSENITISANGSRVSFFRDVANITMDLNGVEGIVFRALGGADNITINDVSGTDLALSGVAIDLAGAGGGGDGAADTVTINGRAGNDNIHITSVNGTILVTGSPTTVAISNAEAANDRLIVNGGTGDDTIDASGVPPGMIGLTIDGGAGNDIIIGSAGGDMLLGGDGNDVVTGGRGDDMALLGAGNDLFVWNPGDGSDIVEGQAGVDALLFNGANANENIDISANGSRVRLFRDIGNVTMDLNGMEGIIVRPGGGADNITINDVTGTDLALSGVAVDLEGAPGSGVGDGQLDTVTINGTNGNDTIRVSSVDGVIFATGSTGTVAILHPDATDQLVINGLAGDDVIDASGLMAGQISLTLNGGAGNDVLIGSQANDVVIGGTGNDLALLGAGNDTFVWNPGDGSDTVEGQGGVDALLFNGANISENITISANGGRVLFQRDVGNVTMDLNGVEGIVFRALDGVDNITINDVSGTDLALSGVAIDLAGAGGGGDGAADTMTINGRAGNDNINISDVNGTVLVTGSPATVAILNAEATNDRLIVNGGAGDDIINASALPAGVIGVTIDGGAGNDVIVGSAGADVLLGGDGNDAVAGGRGDDLAFLGAGNDVFGWNPGDGSDTVEGQAGLDGLIFNGSNANENIDISANGSRVRMFRDVANVTMDLNGVEGIAFHALGGADHIVLNDVSGTDLALGGVTIDLEGTLGSGVADGELDTVTINATAGDDTIHVSSANGVVFTTGSPTPVAILHADAGDQLSINGLAGNDVIDASGVQAGQISLLLNGGAGDDLLIGSQGNDVVTGGTGNDVALLGAGDDVFVWNPGDGSDTVEGQAGVDTLLFNGANINENIAISANGGRVLFQRDVGNVTMDLNGVEGIVFHAAGGADNVTINDVSGTDLARSGIQIDLEGAAGSGLGDGAVDSVTVYGKAGSDTINIGSVNGTVLVTGSPATVVIAHAEAIDHLVVDGGAGDDTINAAGLAAGAIGLTIDGGAGNDALVGGAGNDVLIGGAGLDHLTGGAGQDTFVFTGASLAQLDTGLGANRDVIQDFNADVIDLHQIDANVNTATDEAFSFIGTNAFTAAGQVRFFADAAGNTIVEGNVDNDLHADFQIELHAFAAQLQAGNFVL